jgi:hypothetical protein
MQHEQAIALATTAPAQTHKVDFSGYWTNDLEQSHMTLAQDGHSVTGAYSSPDGKGGTITGQLLGCANGNVISFTVDWPNPSISAWIGHMVTENDNEGIETLWHLALFMPHPNDPTKLWTAMLAGSDRFTRDS